MKNTYLSDWSDMNVTVSPSCRRGGEGLLHWNPLRQPSPPLPVALQPVLPFSCSTPSGGELTLTRTEPRLLATRARYTSGVPGQSAVPHRSALETSLRDHRVWRASAGFGRQNPATKIVHTVKISRGGRGDHGLIDAMRLWGYTMRVKYRRLLHESELQKVAAYFSGFATFIVVYWGPGTLRHELFGQQVLFFFFAELNGDWHEHTYS